LNKNFFPVVKGSSTPAITPSIPDYLNSNTTHQLIISPFLNHHSPHCHSLVVAIRFNSPGYLPDLHWPVLPVFSHPSSALHLSYLSAKTRKHNQCSAKCLQSIWLPYSPL